MDVYIFVCLCVFVSASEATNKLVVSCGMILTLYDWLNKFYSCCMATVVSIVNGHGLGIDTRCGN